MNADEHKIIGKASPRSDGPEKTTGKGKYVVDIALPDMLWCKVLRSPYPHAKILSIATSAAEAGAEERNIMAMTGHKTTQMVRRYIQEANLFKNNALNKIKI